MHFQYFFTALDIRVGHGDVAVKATRPDKRFVQRLWKVGGSYTDNTVTGLESAVNKMLQYTR